jgi:hypothetical protein
MLGASRMQVRPSFLELEHGVIAGVYRQAAHVAGSVLK